uniref:Uncharacterized protein n=1 Tax=Arundo donax TaxID=35708 RepID=A0A0A9B271_ARUDO
MWIFFLVRRSNQRKPDRSSYCTMQSIGAFRSKQILLQIILCCRFLFR